MKNKNTTPAAGDSEDALGKKEEIPESNAESTYQQDLQDWVVSFEQTSAHFKRSIAAATNYMTVLLTIGAVTYFTVWSQTYQITPPWITWISLLTISGGILIFVIASILRMYHITYFDKSSEYEDRLVCHARALIYRNKLRLYVRADFWSWAFALVLTFIGVVLQMAVLMGIIEKQSG